MRLGLLALSLVLLASSASSQTTRYIDVAGTPPGTGTQLDPFTSIQYALEQPGIGFDDIYIVAPGTYVENLQVPANVYVTLTAIGGPDATRLEPAGSGDLVRLDSASRVEFVGFTLAGAYGADAAGVRTNVSSATVVLDGCIVTQCEIALWSLYDVFVFDSTVAGNGLAGRTTGGNVPTIQSSHSIFWANGNGWEIQTGFTVHLFSTGELSTLDQGSFQADPGLWDVAGGDFQLRPGSPAIDAGNPNFPPDGDGSPKDIGVYAYDPNYAPQPTTYCTPKVASDGCVAVIGYQGVNPASVPALSSTDEFLVTSSGVSEFRNGLFFFGLAPSAFPFQGGWFCIQPPTARTLIQNSGTGGSPCTGSFSIDINALFQSGTFPFVGAGSSVYGQYWFRDPNDPFGSVRTNAVALGLAE